MSYHPPAKRYLYRDQWLSAKEIATASGMSYRNVLWRIGRDLSLEHPLPHGRIPKRYEFRGKLATIKEIMAATGLDRTIVQQRHDGIRFYEAHELAAHRDTLPVQRSDSYHYFYDGVSDTLSGWAKRVGIPRATLQARVDNGWTFKETLTTPVRQRNLTHTFKGVTDTLTGWAQRTGVPRGVLYQRIHRHHWPVSVALTQPVIPHATLFARAKTLAKMIDGFHAPSATAVALPSSPTTGGASKTFHPCPKTGAHSQINHLPEAVS